MQFSIETSGLLAPLTATSHTEPELRPNTRRRALGTQVRTDCAIVPVFAGRRLGAAGNALDALLDGALTAALDRGDLADAANSVLLVPGNLAIQRVVLVATVAVGDDHGPAATKGKAKRKSVAANTTEDNLQANAAITERGFQDVCKAAFRAACATGAKSVLSFLAEVVVGVNAVRAIEWKVQVQVTNARDLSYRFDRLRSKREPRREPESIAIAVTPADATAAKESLHCSVAIADGVALARDLGNLPGNFCTPSILADEAKALAKKSGLKVQILDRKQMEALRMGSFLAVAQGSDEPPKLIVLEWRGGEKGAAPIALVGKGVTFDSGGISLKPGEAMDEMKYDMSGASAVLGTMSAAAAMKLPLNIVAVIPATENMPSGRAIKPGDIVTSMSGQTIEILNTDAEGRLILCDALTYVARFEPSTVIDLATLTGACVIALGHHHSGLFTKDDALAQDLLRAGQDTLDTCWRMPLDDEYQEQLKSPFADMANIGGRPGGSITAACFLARFAKGYAWAHLDIAGTAWKSGAAKGSTGRPVPMLTRFLMDRAQALVQPAPTEAKGKKAPAKKRAPRAAE
jgi:leucyl aminopeptidase